MKITKKKVSLGVAIIVAAWALWSVLKPAPAEAAEITMNGSVNYRIGNDENASGKEILKAEDNGSSIGVSITDDLTDGIRGFAHVEVARVPPFVLGPALRIRAVSVEGLVLFLDVCETSAHDQGDVVPRRIGQHLDGVADPAHRRPGRAQHQVAGPQGVGIHRLHLFQIQRPPVGRDPQHGDVGGLVRPDQDGVEQPAVDEQFGGGNELRAGGYVGEGTAAGTRVVQAVERRGARQRLRNLHR